MEAVKVAIKLVPHSWRTDKKKNHFERWEQRSTNLPATFGWGDEVAEKVGGREAAEAGAEEEQEEE